MRLFEKVRKVQPPPTYQFHGELTEKDVEQLSKELQAARIEGPASKDLIDLILANIEQ